MNLYINTSEPYCQIALFKEGEVLAHATYQKTMQHSTVLHDMIQELLHQNNSSFKNLTCITVLNGPGSYTGLRVGLAAAKGFCYSMEIPLILLNKLNLLSEQYLYQNKEINKVACIMAARKEEYFFCIQQREKIIIEPNVQEIGFIKDQLEENDISHLIGPENDQILEEFPNFRGLEQNLKFIADVSVNKLTNNELSDIYRSEPFYLKKVHINKAKKRF